MGSLIIDPTVSGPWAASSQYPRALIRRRVQVKLLDQPARCNLVVALDDRSRMCPRIAGLMGEHESLYGEDRADLRNAIEALAAKLQ
jgi:hypothetical protein